MIIQRKELLAALDSCAAGLGAKGSIEQSSCYIFRDGQLISFNDLLLCVTESPVPLEAAVPAKAFRETLAKFGDDEINVEQTDGKIRVWVKGKKASINGHTDVYLPINEVEKPGEWVDVAPELSDALPLAADCVGADGDVLDNLAIHPKGILSCNKEQAIQFSVLTGIQVPCLIPAEGIKAVAALGIAAICDGNSWLHFKTYSGLRASVRKSTGDYPDVLEVFKQPVIAKVEFPFSASDAFERLAPFLADTSDGKTCTFTIKTGCMVMATKNVIGAYSEEIPLEYEGPEIRFSGNPKMIANVVRHGLPLQVTDSSIRVAGSGFRYVVSISKGKTK